MHRRLTAITLAFLSLLFTARAQQAALAPTPREQLQQYVTQLQANPSDDALRTKIIQLALTLDPKPAAPPEADGLVGRGKYILEHATSDADFSAAADAFAKASLLAPWVPDYYFDEATMLEKEKRFAEAIKNYNLYLMAAPDAQDAKAVREKIGGLQYEVDKQQSAEDEAQAQREREMEAERAREQAAEQAREQQERDEQQRLARLDPIVRSLNGAIYRSDGHDREGNRLVQTYTISGDRILCHAEFNGGSGWVQDYSYGIEGKTYSPKSFTDGSRLIGTISEKEISFAVWNGTKKIENWRDPWGGNPRRVSSK